MLFHWRHCVGTAIVPTVGIWCFRLCRTPSGCPRQRWRVLAKAHEVRNVAAYQGHFDADVTLLRNLIEAAEAVRAAVAALSGLPES